MRAYKNQYGWSIKCKGKTKDGREISGYLPVYFWNCEPEGEQVDFEPVEHFPGVYEKSDGTIGYKMVVKSWQRVVVEEKKSPVKDEDLPF